MNAMDQTIAGAVLERAHIASPKGSLSQAKGQRRFFHFLFGISHDLCFFVSGSISHSFFIKKYEGREVENNANSY